MARTARIRALIEEKKSEQLAEREKQTSALSARNRGELPGWHYDRLKRDSDNAIKQLASEIAELESELATLNATLVYGGTLSEEKSPSDGVQHAFISYSRKDTSFVERLEAALKARGYATWRDATSIPGGDDWYQNIVAGLAGAYAVLCIVSANADDSKWVRREQLRADEDGIPPIAIQPAKYRNPLHLQEVQPILMDDANFASGLVEAVVALERCKAKPRATAPVPAAPVTEVPSDDMAIQEYLKWVLSEAKADLRDALYVDLAAASERAPQPHSKSAMAFGLDDDFTFSSIEMEHLAHDDFAKPGEDVPDARKAIHEMRRAVLLGDPGAGKTTTLLKIAVDLARAAQTDPKAKLPVYIPLREFDGAMSIADFVRAKTHNLQPAFDRLSDRFVLLCDALNEMPRQAEDSRDLVAEVRDTLRDKPDWVVSCRVRDYTDDLSSIDGIGKIRLKPLDPPRIQEFIRRKYTGWKEPERGAVLWRGLGGSDHLLKAWEAFVAHKASDGFWGKEWLPEKPYSLDDERRAWRAMQADHRRLMMLCRSPFMANMVCALYRKSEKLPDNRAGLFRDFVVNLLRAEEKRVTDVGLEWIGDEAIRAGLGQIAWEMGAQTEMPCADAEAILRHHVLGHDPAKVLSAAAAAQLIDYGASIRFTHQLLQQYFAAAVLGTMMDGKHDPASVWTPDTWWESTGREETAILLAGDRNDPSGVARWIAPAQPHLALELLSQPDFALDLGQLDDATRSALIAGAQTMTHTIDARGCAAAYRVLGKSRADRRLGIGVRPDGLPDIDWVPIPAGSFQYGHIGESNNPPQVLNLPAFEIARYPLTYAQFQTFVDDPEGFTNARWWDGLADDEYRRENQVTPVEQTFKFENHPCESVSWYDAIAFCRWFSWHLGGGCDLDNIGAWAVRIPTEYEWEKAARGNDGLIYPYANDFDAAKGNTDETGIDQTSAVGIFPGGLSPYGVLDMSGNVSEWCLTAYRNPAPDAVKENLSSFVQRMYRGGSWNLSYYYARAVYRFPSDPHNRHYSRGFRLCRPPSL